MRIICSFLIFIFNTFVVVGQTYDYVGVLRLPDNTFIKYKASFQEKNGALSGYTISDINGKHETKSTIVGRFDAKQNTLEFREVSIVYTKSDVTQLDFCYVYFSGKLRKLDGKSEIEGAFKSYYNDLEKCLDGELIIGSIEKFERKTDFVKRKIEKSKKMEDSVKQRALAGDIFNRVDNKPLENKEKLAIFWPDNRIELNLWDPIEIDGDKVDVYLNGKRIMTNFAPTKTKKKIILNLELPVNTLKLVATDLGKKPPNTVTLSLVKSTGEEIELSTKLGLNEEVQFLFYKESLEAKKKS